jgi:hypothetical protein
MRNINPNQFALPGMEHLSHPGAPYLPKGVAFQMHHEDFKGGFYDPDAVIHRHTLHAYPHVGGRKYDPVHDAGNSLGTLEWAGHKDTLSHYPGQIAMVERAYGANDWRQKTKGLMTAMYHMGHQLNMGQSTVPLHSPERTAEGEAWSKKVGGPRPEREDYGWKPPIGIHPYEHRNLSHQQFRPKGQQRLPSMGPTTGIK